jgi:hypothetical protein
MEKMSNRYIEFSAWLSNSPSPLFMRVRLVKQAEVPSEDYEQSIEYGCLKGYF